MKTFLFSSTPNSYK